ncbi:MAG: hypothetical protein HY209_00020 [Candidatus Omnitrophica bacterium]|nr:hypothetical protein [Candidatus Omnitrophota bacterium]
MRNTGLLLTLVFFFGFIGKAFYVWQDVQNLQNKNSIAQKEVTAFQSDLKHLESLVDGRLVVLENSYQNLDEQRRLFSQYHDLKISLEVNGLGKDGLIVNTFGPSAWPGIRQMSLQIHFFDLKSMGQYIRVLQFLKTIETVDPLRVLSIVQKGNYLEARLQLYGRGI